jgi:hypothetical protein
MGSVPIIDTRASAGSTTGVAVPCAEGDVLADVSRRGDLHERGIAQIHVNVNFDVSTNRIRCPFAVNWRSISFEECFFNGCTIVGVAVPGGSERSKSRFVSDRDDRA